MRDGVPHRFPAKNTHFAVAYHDDSLENKIGYVRLKIAEIPRLPPIHIVINA
jgi:hypothetical protein